MKILQLISVIRNLLFLWLCLAFSHVIAASDGAGVAFSDPGRSEVLPDRWLKQSIQYRDVPAGSDLVITLDQHLYPALVPIIKDFARQNKLQIAVQEGTCGVSAGALLDKKVDIGGFCCPAGSADRLPGLKFHTLGIAALALITHPDNPEKNMSLDMARQIFSGGIASWNQLQTSAKNSVANNRPIQPLARLHCKNRPGHWKLILPDEDHFSPLTHEISSIPDMIQRVAGYSNSIGYETLWMTRLHNKYPVKTIQINGNAPEDNQALLDGRYPFYRSYNITSWDSDETSKPIVAELIGYIYSRFDSLDTKYGFISSDKLRKANWKFNGDELVSSPE